MANRTVLARLMIDGVSGVVAGFKKSGAAAVEYGRVAQKAGTTATRWMDKHADGLGRIGGSLLKAGAVGAVALGGLAKAAMDWESAWAGVTKTVDGTPAQMAAIEQGLRDMTAVLPASHEELAAVAEAAGQLGIKTDSVLGFTKTMVNLGETTNLSAEQAATSLAQLMNVMGTSQGSVDRLGSAIVALGNDGASTEADIVAMAQRIAAAGNQVGMAETDVLGMASALASVGVEAEAGGTAISLTLKQIDGFVREGGKGLETLAEVSGMTADQFVSAWKQDAAGTVAAFTEGLGGMVASGEDANAVLGELGMTGIRQSDSLLRLAGATKAAGTEQDLLREALTLSADAWAENAALTDEANKRYQTREAQAQMAINSIKDEAITLGQTLLPAVDSVLRAVTGLAEGFGSLDESTRAGLTGIAVVGTAAALAAGGVMKGVQALHNFKVALGAIGVSARTATLSMGAIGVALSIAGFALSTWMGKQEEARQLTADYTQALRENNGVLGESARVIAAKHLQDKGALDDAKQMGISLRDMTDAALGNAEARQRVNEQIEAHKRGLESEQDALIESGKSGEAVAFVMAGFDNQRAKINETLDQSVDALDKTIASEQQLAEATADGTDASQQSADAAQRQAESQAQLASEMQASAEAQRQLLEATQAYADALLQLSGSQIAVESSIADLNTRMAELNEGGEENRRTLDLTTEAGRQNQRALDDLARSSMSYVETLYDQGASSDEIAAATSRAREQWIKGAEAMGMQKSQAQLLADAYFAIPTTVDTDVSAPGATAAKAQVDNLRESIKNLPAEKRSVVQAMLDAGNVEGALDYLARDRIAMIKVRTAGGSSVPVAGRRVAQAEGGTVDYYATGDIRNRHIAQIAPKGAYRVWAEEETEGEAYIPFRRDTRPRSIEIWKETGRRLGVYHYADGMVVGRQSAPVREPALVSGPSIVVNGARLNNTAEVMAELERAQRRAEVRRRFTRGG